MNSCTFSGRLGRDPELRATRDGHPVCSFSLAVNRYKRDAGAIWFDVSVWGKQGENAAKYLAKGSEVVVAGSVDSREYEKRDGTTGFALTLNAREVSFVGSRQDGDEQRAERPTTQAPASSQPADDDDIPF